MSDEGPNSVTRLIEGLKAGQPEAADALWRRYYQRVVALARRRLQSGPHQAIEDAEDVALSALHGLCAGATQGRFDRLNDRVDLWRLLAAITVKKVLSRQEWYGRQKRGGDQIVPNPAASAHNPNADPDDSDPDAMAFVASKEPTPESAAIVQEQFQELLDALPDPILRQIALWRLDGLSNIEIAQKLGRVVRTVERKIERIRMIWTEIGTRPHD
jgi:RNA polymerase sigma factor (sigma-70 family)